MNSKLRNHLSYKMLTVIDEYKREALSVTVAIAIRNSEVLAAPYPLLIKRGTLEYLRSNNGSTLRGQDRTLPVPERGS